MTFRVEALRFRLRARDTVVFPAGKAGNVFRGAFGLALKAVASPEEYRRLFEPSAEAGGPSGLADRPRPFVLRAAALDGCRFEPGREFALDIHVFETTGEASRCLRAACALMGEQGIGPGRGRFDIPVEPDEEVVDLDLRPADAVGRVRVEFLTPTELKSAGEVQTEPAFDVLFARLRDRISTLRQLYQDGPLDIDFRAMAARATTVRLAASNLRHEAVERLSTRTGQTHPLGGITGWAAYEGELGEFLPFLHAGFWTGVGRQTVWGKGVIRVAKACVSRQ